MPTPYGLEQWPRLTIPPLLVTCANYVQDEQHVLFHCTHPHVISLHRTYASLFPSAGFCNVLSLLFWAGYKNKLYFFLHALIAFTSRLAIARLSLYIPCKTPFKLFCSPSQTCVSLRKSTNVDVHTIPLGVGSTIDTLTVRSLLKTFGFNLTKLLSLLWSLILIRFRMHLFINLLVPGVLLIKLLWPLIAKVRNGGQPVTLMISIDFLYFCFAQAGEGFIWWLGPRWPLFPLYM